VAKKRETTPQPPSRLLDAQQVAELLGISADKLYRAAASGEIPSYLLANRTRRFDPLEVHAWLRTKRTGPDFDISDLVMLRILSGQVGTESIARLRQALDDVLREAA
jgi:excisionase family DNA binding protein